LEGTKVTANALHPGVVDTEIIRHMGFFNNFFAGLVLNRIPQCLFTKEDISLTDSL